LRGRLARPETAEIGLFSGQHSTRYDETSFWIRQ